MIVEPGEERAEEAGGDAGVRLSAGGHAAERLFAFVDHDDGGSHRVDDPQGRADVRFTLANEATEQAPYIEDKRRPTRFVAERLAKLALAENCSSNSEYDKAISLYQQLLGQAESLRPAIQLGLGRAYEKSGDPQKAAEAYFEAAKLDRSSPVGAEAELCLKRVDPSRIKDLPAPESIPIQP